MGILDKLFGRARPPERSTRATPAPDDQAIEKYQYLLRTAPPEALEEAHAEAFAKLTPEQRAEVLRRFSSSLPAPELAAARSGDPRALARAATRAELRSPGFMERTLGPGGMGMGSGLGGAFGSSLLGSLAGSLIGSAIASHLLHGFTPGMDVAPAGGLFGSADPREDMNDPDFSDVVSDHGTSDGTSDGDDFDD